MIHLLSKSIRVALPLESGEEVDEVLEYEGYEPAIVEWVRGLDDAQIFDSPLPDEVAYLGVRTDSSKSDVIRSIPYSWVGEGGIRIHFTCPDGQLVVFIEDWLSGCIPKQMSYGTEETEDYCRSKAEERKNSLSQVLGSSWELIKDQNNPEDRTIRYIWQK